MCNYPTSLSLQVSTKLHVEFNKHVPRHPTGDRLNQRTDTGSEEAKSARNLRKNLDHHSDHHSGQGWNTQTSISLSLNKIHETINKLGVDNISRFRDSNSQNLNIGKSEPSSVWSDLAGLWLKNIYRGLKYPLVNIPKSYWTWPSRNSWFPH